MSFNRENSDCPCMDCKDRVPGTGCHDRCEAFKAWRKKLDDRNEARRKAKNCNTMSDANKKAMWRNARYSRHRKKLKGES